MFLLDIVFNHFFRIVISDHRLGHCGLVSVRQNQKGGKKCRTDEEAGKSQALGNAKRGSGNIETVGAEPLDEHSAKAVPSKVHQGDLSVKFLALVEDIQKKIYNSLAQEVTSKELGEMVCEALKNIDEVAYVRFASVYRSFTDTTSFIKELEKMVKKDK